MNEEIDELKKALDDVIYTWAKLSETLAEGDNLHKYYPLEEGSEEFLHLLINWRTSLD
ncbi:hypothetical protein D3C74_196860 [compost metagenome]